MQYKLDLISSIGKITFFLMLLLSVFLFTVKASQKTPNRLFAVLLLLIAFDLSGFFIGGWFDARPYLNMVKTVSSLVQMPLFYLYVRSTCYSDFKLNPWQWVHGIPALLFLVLFWATSFSTTAILWFEIAGELQWFVYMIAVFLVLKHRKEVYHENYSRPSSKLYTWLFQFAVLSCIGHSFVLLRWVLSLLSYDQIVLNINIIISFFTLFIITWFVLKALYHPILFTGVKSTQKPLKPENQPKLSRSHADRLDKEIERLQQYMVHEKPYLDFELTLQKLAAQINIPEKELSLALNHQLGKHFFDFVNEYRISEAKLLLGSTEKRNLTISEIVYQVGFNSKSSFYTAFKKMTDQTPTDYRKAKLAN